ncbi:MAG: BCD family MFS transporter [Candidatus Promineifilaceae bacterium]
MTTSNSQLHSSIPPIVDSDVKPTQIFQLGLVLRLSTFQIGSAMGDILTAGVWNRIMISDFGIPAWPVGLLLALKYFMAPVSLWIGYRSDTKPLFGQYRTSYIWLGRGAILLSLLFLGFSTVQLEDNTGNVVGWAAAVFCFLLYGLGTLFSASPYLALVRDSAPREKQGVSIGIAETMLIAFFPVVAIGFSRMLTSYDPALFWRLIFFVIIVGGLFWFFAVVGVEKRNKTITQAAHRVKQVDLQATFRKIWQDKRTRRFFIFLFVATFAAWMQDNILEPLGADIFKMAVEETTRLGSYWGTATILVLVASFVIWRKKLPEEQAGIAGFGLAIMGLGMLFLAGSALAGEEHLFLTALVVFGAGFGFYTFGGLSLMAAMSPDPHAGAYLGLWTVATLVSKGLGTFIGGVSRDVVLALSHGFPLAYGVTCVIAGIGLFAAVWILRGVNVPEFVREAAAEMKQ